ncbi:fumarylacetoacetate hydrolase family protein [Granulosicoccus antarcticus]|uniref:Ureidoglycolate lyase n=1 Tax=Granulosicoccus antarcticus IMCC3135 TaxID=1192854 RepID=A0A2Z2NXD6_9GAMM|nr:fumarylacetoacetate hydrolase family protein [Granulosicoccus antarcticus]ASJ76106.1 Ureidoglycolate lyase [Granulosicoccus antarcticus IMCC3135]
MHFATIAVKGLSVAVVRLNDDSVLEIAKAATSAVDGAAADSLREGSLQAIIEGGAEALEAVRTLVAEAESGKHADALHAIKDIELLAPIPSPRKNIFCVGRNYAEHIAEGDRAQKQTVGVTEYPVYFTKPPTAVIGPKALIPIFPSLSENIDYEVELTLVIGKAGRNISSDQAYDHIFGYTIINDITARDIQRRHGGQYFKGKGLDGSCPCGPWIVTADAISDPHNLSIGLSVNGEVRQNGSTSDMIFDIPTLIESLSQGLTLEPGDMLATGTPSGVGYAMDPPKYLKDGDTVVCEISEIGQLENTMTTAT